MTLPLSKIQQIILLLSFHCLHNLAAQYPNIRVSSVHKTDPQEVSIAINPTNPLNIVAGANIDYYYFSMDGGQTWVEGELYSTLGVWGDPCVTFDADGHLYFGHLSNPLLGYWIDRIVVQKSLDGGQHWNDGIGVGYLFPKNQDKEWLIADHTNSPYRNNLYMAWTEFDQYGSRSSSDSSRIRFSRSIDQGDTWSPAIVISDRGGDCIDDDNTVEGAVPAVGPNGEVYVSWSGNYNIMFDKSLDGGKTFGKDVFITRQPWGWNFDIPGIYRCNGMPITLCDMSDSPYRGTIYVIWSDQRNGVDDTDIFLKKSTDLGTTWSELKRINDDHSKRHQFFPWATIDPITGNLYVVFYDRRSTTLYETDVYVAISTDGGETFNNIEVSESSFTPSSSKFFGDYINIAAYNGKIYPIWARMDNANLSIWMAIIDKSVTAVEKTKMNPDNIDPKLQNYPNPFNSFTNIFYSILHSTTVRLTVYNAIGEIVTVLIDEKLDPGDYSIVWNASGLTSGLYFYKLETGDTSVMKKCLYVK